ncbi:hypothetical protein HanPSC8_Chr13g0592281 [Helianthus annuus]|nr:hypothetical protein HanPSC8_Chr13g0592281 [Helianthus annuus]
MPVQTNTLPPPELLPMKSKRRRRRILLFIPPRDDGVIPAITVFINFMTSGPYV